MSATAFQRARREAAATMRAAAESVQEEQELYINETNQENETSTNEGTLQEEALHEENANEQESDSDTKEENAKEQESDSDTKEENAKEENLPEKEYTVAQLKTMCDEKGIEYKARATKAELIELLGM